MRKDGAVRALLSCLALPAFLGSCSWCEGFPALEGRSGKPTVSLLVLAEKVFLSPQLLHTAPGYWVFNIEAN